MTRWAIAGGIPWTADRIGDSAFERLALPAGIAPGVEGALTVIAERLRPAVAPSVRSFRLLLAGYSDVHSFGIPPCTVVVTAGLVCASKDQTVVASVVARELAHLESHDVSRHAAETVDWHTALELAHGDVSTVRARMLDFADPERDPGFPPELDVAAERRGSAILAASALIPDVGEARARAQGPDWSKVRGEACELVGSQPGNDGSTQQGAPPPK